MQAEIISRLKETGRVQWGCRDCFTAKGGDACGCEYMCSTCLACRCSKSGHEWTAGCRIARLPEGRSCNDGQLILHCYQVFQQRANCIAWVRSEASNRFTALHGIPLKAFCRCKTICKRHGTCGCNAKLVDKQLLAGCSYCSTIALEAVACTRMGLYPPQTAVSGCTCAFCDTLTQLARFGVNTARYWWAHPDVKALVDSTDPWNEDAWCRGNRDEAIELLSQLHLPDVSEFVNNPVLFPQLARQRTNFQPKGTRGSCGHCCECKNADEPHGWAMAVGVASKNKCRSGAHGKDLVACGDVEENPGPITLGQVVELLEAHYRVASWVIAKLWQHIVVLTTHSLAVALTCWILGDWHHKRTQMVEDKARVLCLQDTRVCMRQLEETELARADWANKATLVGIQYDGLKTRLVEKHQELQDCHNNLTLVNMTFVEHLAECDGHFKNLSQQMHTSLVLKGAECEQHTRALEIQLDMKQTELDTMTNTLEQVQVQRDLLQEAYESRGVIISYFVLTGYCVSGVVFVTMAVLALLQILTWLWATVHWLVKTARKAHYASRLALYDTEITVYVNTPYGNNLCRDLIDRSCMEFRKGGMQNEASREYCLRCFRFAEMEVYGEGGGGAEVELPPWQWYSNHCCPVIERTKYTVPVLAARYFHILLGARLRAETGHKQMRGQKYGLFKWGQVEEYSPEDDPEHEKVVVNESGAERASNRLPNADYGPAAPALTYDETIRTQHFVTPTRRLDPLEAGAQMWMSIYYDVLRSKAYQQLLPTVASYATDAPGGRGVAGTDFQYTQDKKKFEQQVQVLVRNAINRVKPPELPAEIAEQLDWWFFRMVNNDFEARVSTAGQTGSLAVNKPKIRRIVMEYRKKQMQPDLQRIQPLLKQAVSAADDMEAEALARQAREMVEQNNVPPEVLEMVTRQNDVSPTGTWADIMEQEEMAQQEMVLLVYEWLKRNQASSSNTRVESIMKVVFSDVEAVKKPAYIHVDKRFKIYDHDTILEAEEEAEANRQSTLVRMQQEQQLQHPMPESKDAELPLQKVLDMFKALQIENVRQNQELRQMLTEAFGSKNVVKNGKAQPEAQVFGSATTPSLRIVAAMADGNGKYISQGYLRNTAFACGGTKLAFGTARHRYADTGPLRLVDGLMPLGTKVQLRVPGRVAPYEATIEAAHSPEGDELWYLLAFQGETPVVPSYDLVKPQDLVKYRVGAAVSAVPFVMKGGDFYKGEFEVIPGTLNGVTNAKAITYQMSTNYGYCRMAVFAANGRLLCGHWDGNSPCVSPPRPGGSLCVAPPGKLQDWKVAAFDVHYYGGGGPQAILEHPLVRCPRQFVGYTEDQKKWNLRTDMGDFHGLATEYTLMRPSTTMNLAEIGQFGTRIQMEELDWSRASQVLTNLEHKLVDPVPEVDKERILECVRAIGTQPKMAGPGRPLHKQFLEQKGNGEYERGVELVAEEIWQFVKQVQNGRLEKSGVDFWRLMKKWTVFGKLDKYKQKKMHVGRTIQAPPLELKVLHLAFFSERDEAWCCRMAKGEPSWVFAGHDFDMPVAEKRIRIYANALAALALDMTAFDRRMTGEMISAHFEHLDAIYPGVPHLMYQMFYDVVTNTQLVLSDGTTWQKSRGNPSGYPNTLRLNCSVNMMSWILCLEQLMGWQDCSPEELRRNIQKHFHIEICGDDSRVWALTSAAVECLQRAAQWWQDNLPWEAKVEGFTIFQRELGFNSLLMAPPMVSRRLTFFKFGGDVYMFEPLADVSRCLSRWLHNVERTIENQEEVELGVSTTVALLWYQTMVVGFVESPMIRAFDMLATVEMKENMRHRVGHIWSLGIPQVPFLTF